MESGWGCNAGFSLNKQYFCSSEGGLSRISVSQEADYLRGISGSCGVRQVLPDCPLYALLYGLCNRNRVVCRPTAP